MKIDKISLPEEYTKPYDLAPIKMEKLSRVVMLAGKNGAGKTRFFNLLKQMDSQIPDIDGYQKAIKNIQQQERNILIFQEAIRNVERDTIGIDAEERKSLIAANIKSYEENILSNKNAKEKLLKTMKTTETIHFTPHKDNGKIVDFVPKQLELKDSYTLSNRDIDTRSKGIYTLGISNMADNVLPAIQKIQNQWANAQLSALEASISKEELDAVNINYNRLKNYIGLFLNTELHRDINGNATIFGKRLGAALLSDGQKILLQFCIALFGQEANLSELIVFMDEPENHLHPAALIEVLDKIVANIPNGQLWIATHSINVLAHFDPSYIWYIEKGEISYAGNLPQKVLDGLLGEEDEIERLSSFLSLPAKMASDKFAFESLFYPNVAMTGNDDPQTAQIFEIISERAKNQNPLRILDFGMGQGRLLAAIYENNRLQDIELKTWLDYNGFDAFDTYKKQCEEQLDIIYGDKKRYFNKPNQILTEIQEYSLDFIVMCNVLHEIDPNNWLNLFNSHDSLMKLLKPDGHLMIVEDQFLAIGEKAHAKGFTVLDSLELKRLFKADEENKIISRDYRGDGRLKAHLISSKLMGNVNAQTREAALKTLSESAKREIKTLRDSSPSFKNGKLHSFWAQQLANATLSLEQLTS